jgi:hypothetical protein
LKGQWPFTFLTFSIAAQLEKVRQDCIDTRIETGNMPNEKAEIARKKYLYRRLIIQGKLRIKHELAKQLIGPDTAYHLYSRYGIKGKN